MFCGTPEDSVVMACRGHSHVVGHSEGIDVHKAIYSSSKKLKETNRSRKRSYKFVKCLVECFDSSKCCIQKFWLECFSPGSDTCDILIVTEKSDLVILGHVFPTVLLTHSAAMWHPQFTEKLLLTCWVWINSHSVHLVIQPSGSMYPRILPLWICLVQLITFHSTQNFEISIFSEDIKRFARSNTCAWDG